jgi:hypothetical protein
MTMSPITANGHSPGPAGWLSLAAAPTFAVMALIGATGMSGFCMSGSGLLPGDDMTRMYLLMSLFHLPPWLRLALGHARPGRRPQIKGDRP